MQKRLIGMKKRWVTQALLGLSFVLSSGLALSLEYGYISLPQSSQNTAFFTCLRYVAETIFALYAFTASFMLVSTFAGVTVRPDGTWCYNPENLFWRFQRWVGIVGEDETAIKVCKSFHLTFLVMTLWAVVIGMVSVAVFGLASAGVGSVRNGTLREDAASTLVLLGSTLCIVGVLLGLMWLLIKASEKSRLVGVVGGVLLVAVFVGGIVGVPMWHMMVNEHHTFSQAVLIYLRWAVIILGAGAALVGFVWGLFKLIPVLKRSWIGRLVSEKLCPTLYACPLPETSSENS